MGNPLISAAYCAISSDVYMTKLSKLSRIRRQRYVLLSGLILRPIPSASPVPATHDLYQWPEWAEVDM